MANRSPRVIRFLEWLEQRIANGRPGEPLATLRDHSARWGISERTVRRLLVPYVAAGRIHSVAGRGTFIGPMPPPASPDPAHTPTSRQTIAQNLISSIGSGTLKRGDMLPPVKALALTFHVAPATVSRAYAALRDRGLLTRVGKNYFVGPFRSMRGFTRPARVVVLHRDPDIRAVMERFDHHHPITEMEMELLEYGIRTVWEPIDHLERFARSAPSPATIGVVVTEIDDPYYRRLLPTLRLLRRKHDRSALSVLLVGGYVETLDRRMHMFSGGTSITAMARSAAAFAVGKGMDTVVMVLDKQTPRGPSLVNLARVETELCRLNPAAAVSYLAPRGTGVQTPRDLLRIAASAWGTSIPDFVSYLETLMSRYGRRTVEDLLSKVRMVGDLASEYRRMPSGTLCMFARDESASTGGLDLCRKARRAVPREISLLGFGNDHRFFHEGITTCVPDWRTIGYLMAHALLGDLDIQRGRKGYLRVPACVLERRTTP